MAYGFDDYGDDYDDYLYDPDDYYCDSDDFFHISEDEDDYGDFDDFADDFGSQNHRRRRATPGSASSVRHNQSSLQLLYQKGETYVKNKANTRRACAEVYRDKSKMYFDNILSNGGPMTVYTKDYHGDPKSPANGRVDGLFFSVNVDKMTGTLPRKSIYGEKRFVMPTQRLFDICTNIYFTDFYCVNQKAHYITLVMTKTGSAADEFGKQNLIPFNMDDNPFFRRSEVKMYYVTDAVWVEVLVTENIDINQEILKGAHWSTAEMTGKRTGGITGLAKSSSCRHCNI